MPEMQDPLVRQTEEEIKKQKRKDYLKLYYARNYERLKKHYHAYYLQNKEAVLEHVRRYRKTHPQKGREKNQKYYAKHPEKRREKLRRYRAKYPEKVRSDARKYRALNRDKHRKDSQERHLRIKLETLQAYGGPICKCCGETMLETLSIDHIHNGKGNPAKRNGDRSNFYCWLRRNNYPQGDYQVLCLQCNFLKGIYGSCPHQKIQTPINLFFNQN